MTEPRAPWKELLRDPVSEHDIQKAWRGIQASRAQGSTRSSRWTVGWIAAGALAACLAFMLVWATPGASSEPRELRTESGEPLEVLAAAETEARAVQLSDGSRITLEPGAEAEVLENTDRSFVTKLRKGKTRFEVRPGGPRRWSVECSLATIEVVGTAFTVHRTERQVRVDVHKGIVLVRGERVPERVQRLTAGQHLELTEAAPQAAAPSPEPAPEPEPAAPAVQQPVAPPPPAAPPPAQPESWRAAAAKGDHASAYARLGDRGLEREARRARDIDTLLMLADVARQSGHPQQAAQMLEQAMREHPRDSRAGLAAFTLGRLELETLGRPARAAEAFQRVIALGEPRSLQEDAHARLVQAHSRAGAWEQAREAATRYEQLYPQGYRLQDVRRWAVGP
ncbi:MAG TPA: FecR domain-containing protein [Myxococcaceae bacterium]|jgi:transmembrane sensor